MQGSLNFISARSNRQFKQSNRTTLNITHNVSPVSSEGQSRKTLVMGVTDYKSLKLAQNPLKDDYELKNQRLMQTDRFEINDKTPPKSRNFNPEPKKQRPMTTKKGVRNKRLVITMPGSNPNSLPGTVCTSRAVSSFKL